MKKIILAKKIGMTQIWKDDKIIPVTLVQAGPCSITQLMAKEKDGYDAVQIGFQGLRKRKITKSKKKKPFSYLKEFKTKGEQGEIKKGDIIDVNIFEQGDKVKVSAISKGKGFQGGVKRWGFAGRKKTHGTKHESRTIGSIGSSFPQRVLKGKRMPGRMGTGRITVKNLEIVKIDKEKNQIALKGAIPGRKGTLVEIKEF
ncbi:50S ribosomal protein L3 [Patescibacteria group bacterium]|nr:50S ribosomal protein L3 [Patescibacteria group bacterium]MBU4162467.1 50S ribosomal protein L3 [Patescibacteria group bacterium]